MIHWLEWAKIPLKSGRGGVEVHVRALIRELKKRGVECEISERREDLYNKKWTIVRTHGCSYPFFWKRPKTELWMHTLHGTTLGRMWACREFLWIGGYAAALREIAHSLRCDVLVTVNPELWMYRLLRFFGKKTISIGNGWDTNDFEDDSPYELGFKLPEHFYVYVGRAEDKVKGVGLIHSVLESLPTFHLVAIPGDGFQENKRVVKTGPLASKNIKTLLFKSQGLLFTSYYEGLGTVVIEALGCGIPVYSTNVSILKSLSKEVKGLTVFKRRDEFFQFFIENKNVHKIITQDEIKKNAQWNQKILKTWQQLAHELLQGAQQSLERKRE